MKRSCIVFVVIFFFISVVSSAQTKMTRREYIDTYKELAIREMHRSGIPASITLAQACLESDNGNSKLATEAKNHFGIKCKSSWNGPRAFHNDDEQNECFRKYQEILDSYVDHTDFLLANPRYAFLFKISHLDYEAWAKGLRTAGYATDPNYPARLIKIIDEEQLMRYDRIKPEELTQPDILAEKGKKFDPEKARMEAQERNKKTFGEFYLTLSPQRREAKKVNGLDAILVEEGDTYASIAEEFEMKEWEIRTYNDLHKDSPEPKIDDVLYLVRKRFIAEKGNDTHVVRPQESMWSISQKYGIKMSRLYWLNRMKNDQAPVVGDTLNLRKRVKKVKQE